MKNIFSVYGENDDDDDHDAAAAAAADADDGVMGKHTILYSVTILMGGWMCITATPDFLENFIILVIINKIFQMYCT